jgi:hypothetical protein
MSNLLDMATMLACEHEHVSLENSFNKIFLAA